ncbi:zinc finger protein 2-like [Centruroides sculpturatus]|uniref:zinc finger protein 2-like n=1 Tax=Centruroides sculpturatus TaxID=218467 RepID=UPI000C6D9930|nr:zinc finger protein 2-like [Centruroides sculpturatus]
MKIKEELETKHSDFTIKRNEENFEVDLKNFKKEFNTDVKSYKTIKLERKINIKGKLISTNNTNESTRWSHSGYKIERDIKKEEEKEYYDVKHGIKSECKVVLRKLKIEVKTEVCNEVVYLSDANEHVMTVNNQSLNPDENFNRNEMNIQTEEEEKIQEYDFQRNSIKQERYKYNIKTKKCVSSSRKCNKIDEKIKRKYFKILFASHSKQKFTCDLCKQTFTNKSILQTHLFCHIGKKPFRCTTCNKTYLWQFLFKKHMKEHKTGNQKEISLRNLRLQPSNDRKKPSPTNSKKSNIKRKNVYCDICGKRVPYGKGRLERHKRIHRTHACKTCGKEFKWNYMLLCHERTHSEDRPFKCDICNKSFKWKGQMKRHQETHTDGRNYFCQECNKSFKTKHCLITHKIVHNDKFNHTCHICNKRFKRSGHLKQHMCLHSNEYKYSCDICNKYFKTKLSLTLHKVVHNNQFNHTCHVCNKSFKRSAGLKLHIRTHTDEYKYSCNICNKYFKTKHYLRNHKVIHRDTKKYVCDICKKGYNFTTALAKHCLTKHENMYLCSICKKLFKNKNTLEEHLKVHIEKCNICNKEFKTKTTLINHQKIHFDIKPFRCEKCNRGFINKHRLKCHEATHNEDNLRYVCEVCNKGFYFKSHLVGHQLVHQNHPYFCSHFFELTDVKIRETTNETDTTKYMLRTEQSTRRIRIYVADVVNIAL